MAPPLPTVAAQGLGSVGSDQLNTYVQTVQNFAQLRSFVALNDMSVQVLGGASEGDGSQGLFWYDASSTAPDDNATVIVPTGNTQGAWLLLPPGSQSLGNFASLDVSGNAVVGGNLSVGGTLTTTGVATFDADVLMTGTGEVQVPAGTTAQRSASPAPGMIRYNTSLSIFEGYGGSWISLGATGVVQPPNCRLTLSSGVPVLSSAVNSSAGVILTPYNGNAAPQWNGSAWSSAVFPEISQALSDTINSPAAAIANSLYNVYLWYKAGVATLSRGPVVTNPSLSLTRVNGFLVNTLAITNGPAAGYGLYVGTIATDVSGLGVTFNPTPAAASGGPTTGAGGVNPGAWIGLWNTFNRVSVGASAQDSKASWNGVGGSSWAASDASTKNRITYVAGNAYDSVTASFVGYVTGISTSVVVAAFGIGVDSVSVQSGDAGLAGADAQNGASSGNRGSYTGIPGVGQHYLQALELTSATNSTIYGLYASGVQAHGLSAQVWF